MTETNNIPSQRIDKSDIVKLEKGKIAPNAIDIEDAVIGSIIIDKKGVDDALMLIKNPAVFYKESNKVIFTAIQALHLKNEPIDLVSVNAQLRSTKELEAAGGDWNLITLTQKISSSAHIEYHCRLLLQFYVKRQMIRDAAETMAKAYDADADIFDLLGDASLKLDSLIEQTSTGRGDTLMVAALNQVEKRIELVSSKSINEISGVHTGFKKVDLSTGGWQPSDLIIIAARPGMGKTSLVMKGVLDCVKSNVPVGFISLEMSTVQLVTRMVACNSHFHLKQLFRDGFSKTKYFEQFMMIKAEMSKYPVYWDDNSSDLMDVMAKIRLWVRKFGVRKVVVDYLQLMSFSQLKKNGNREQEISTITRNLKKLAKELNIPIILLSQLSRDLEKRGDKRPMLADLRESGAIEQDADVVAFIYRPSYYKLEPDDDMAAMGANAEFIIAKNRNGDLGRKGLFFDENKTKFMDPDDRLDTDRQDAMMYAEAEGNVIKPLPTPTASEAFGALIVGNDNDDTPF
jgi:replicative DNA helicase